MQKRGSPTPARRFNDLETASALSLQALAYIVGDDIRASRFLALTGLNMATLRTDLDGTDVQAAVLEYLLGDESLLLAFCAEADVPPEAVAPAHHALSRSGT